MMLLEFFVNLLPLGIVKKLYGLRPPTAGFRTTTGRIFRLIKVTDNLCLAVASEEYDPKVIEMLTAMRKKGEALIETSIEGLNMLSFDARESIMLKNNEQDRLDNLTKALRGDNDV